PAGRRKIQEEQRSATLLNRADHLVQIAPHEELAAGQVHPLELRPALEEQSDFLGRHLVHALLLPDVAHLAAEVAVIRRDERHLVGQRRRTNIGAENRPGEANLTCQHAGNSSMVTEPDRGVKTSTKSIPAYLSCRNCPGLHLAHTTPRRCWHATSAAT